MYQLYRKALYVHVHACQFLENIHVHVLLLGKNLKWQKDS